MGVVRMYRCGYSEWFCKEVWNHRYPHNNYYYFLLFPIYSACIILAIFLAAASLYFFVHLKNVFSFFT